MEVMTPLFDRNFESMFRNLFLRVPRKNFERCDKLNMQTLKYTYLLHSVKKTLPLTSAEKSSANKTRSKTRTMAKRIRHFQLNPITPVKVESITPDKLHLPRDHVEANEVVQHCKLPMYIPFLTPRNDRILNRAFPSWGSPGIKVELHALAKFRY